MTSRITSLTRRNAPPSATSPFVAETYAGAAGRSASTPRNALEGTATTANAAPSRASAASAVGWMYGGNATPGR